MKIRNVQMAIGATLILVMTIPGGSPGLSKTLNDYSKLIADLSDAKSQIANAKDHVVLSDEKRKELEKQLEDLEKKLEKLKAEQEELKDKGKLFGDLFGSDSCGSRELAPQPVPRAGATPNDRSASTRLGRSSREQASPFRRAIAGYGTLISDLRELGSEVARRKDDANISSAQRQELSNMYAKLIETAARLSDAQRELQTFTDRFADLFSLMD